MLGCKTLQPQKECYKGLRRVLGCNTLSPRKGVGLQESVGFQNLTTLKGVLGLKNFKALQRGCAVAWSGLLTVGYESAGKPKHSEQWSFRVGMW